MTELKITDALGRTLRLGNIVLLMNKALRPDGVWMIVEQAYLNNGDTWELKLKERSSLDTTFVYGYWHMGQSVCTDGGIWKLAESEASLQS